jgi:hypothetical protein
MPTCIPAEWRNFRITSNMLMPHSDHNHCAAAAAAERWALGAATRRVIHACNLPA